MTALKVEWTWRASIMSVADPTWKRMLSRMFLFPRARAIESFFEPWITALKNLLIRRAATTSAGETCCRRMCSRSSAVPKTRTAAAETMVSSSVWRCQDDGARLVTALFARVETRVVRGETPVEMMEMSCRQEAMRGGLVKL